MVCGWRGARVWDWLRSSGGDEPDGQSAQSVEASSRADKGVSRAKTFYLVFYIYKNEKVGIRTVVFMPVQRQLLSLLAQMAVGWRFGHWTERHCTDRAPHKRARKITVHLNVASKTSVNSVISARRWVCLSGRNSHPELRNQSLCWHVGVDEAIVFGAHSRNSQISLLLCSFVTNVGMLPGYQMKAHRLIMITSQTQTQYLIFMWHVADAVTRLD